MTQVIIAVGKLIRQRDGQDLLEYGLLAALISVFAFGAVQLLGNTIYNLFWARIAQNF
jgi:Flp pilus assembly pilin Flp